MRVVAMSWLEVIFFALAVSSIALAIGGQWWLWLVYPNSVILFAMLYVQVISLPLNLNWSRGSYARLLKRMLAFVIFTAVIYAAHYRSAGLFEAGKRSRSFIDSLYFSFTTWTTLGYGDLSVARDLRLATSLEALTGLVTIAVLMAMVWLYCQERLRPQPDDLETGLAGMRMTTDPVIGGWRECPSEKTEEEQRERARRVKLNTCGDCGNAKPVFDKFYQIEGTFAPFPYFVVVCSCGKHSKAGRTAYAAAWSWNKANRRRPPN